MNTRERVLKDICWSWTWTVDKVLQDSMGKRLYGSPTFQDQQRLLSLRTWTIKYRVDLEFILRILVGYWSARFSNHTKFKKGNSGLGCKIATLCGDASEAILASRLKEDYPNNEQLAIWKTHEQEKQLRRNEELVETKIMAQTLDQYVAKYRRKVIKERKEYHQKINSGKLTRRQYPGSPWV